MSLQINPEEIDFDPGVAGLIARLRRLKAEISELTDQADILTEQIKSAMGDAIIGTVNGAPAVKWSIVETNRFDTKKAKELLPEQVVQLLTIKSTSKRFTLLDGDEQW